MLKEDLGEGEIWFFHLVIGDGVFANERACRIVLAKVPPPGQREYEYPLPIRPPCRPSYEHTLGIFFPREPREPRLPNR